MTDRIEPAPIERMTCAGCGTTMNPHAEKPISPSSADESAAADWILGGVVEEIHQCPSCGEVESRRPR